MFSIHISREKLQISKPARSEQGVEPFWFSEIGKIVCFISALCTAECDTEAERLSLRTKALRLLPWGTMEELKKK